MNEYINLLLKRFTKCTYIYETERNNDNTPYTVDKGKIISLCVYSPNTKYIL